MRLVRGKLGKAYLTARPVLLRTKPLKALVSWLNPQPLIDRGVTRLVRYEYEYGKQ